MPVMVVHEITMNYVNKSKFQNNFVYVILHFRSAAVPKIQLKWKKMNKGLNLSDVKIQKCYLKNRHE